MALVAGLRQTQPALLEKGDRGRHLNSKSKQAVLPAPPRLPPPLPSLPLHVPDCFFCFVLHSSLAGWLADKFLVMEADFVTTKKLTISSCHVFACVCIVYC